MKTEINIYVVIAILFIHWFADFVAQSDLQAKNKSKSWYFLLEHTGNYSFIWWIVGLGYIGFKFDKFPIEQTLMPLAKFVLITFVCHTITDYFTSRLNSKLWTQGNTHNFFVSIGWDQFLHFTQLLITYQLLF